MFQQAVFGSNVDRRKSKREEGGGSKGYRCPRSELARCGAEGENGSCTAPAALPAAAAERNVLPLFRRENSKRDVVQPQATSRPVCRVPLQSIHRYVDYV